jgi:hypothetical protein
LGTGAVPQPQNDKADNQNGRQDLAELSEPGIRNF